MAGSSTPLAVSRLPLKPGSLVQGYGLVIEVIFPALAAPSLPAEQARDAARAAATDAQASRTAAASSATSASQSATVATQQASAAGTARTGAEAARAGADEAAGRSLVSAQESASYAAAIGLQIFDFSFDSEADPTDDWSV